VGIERGLVAGDASQRIEANDTMIVYVISNLVTGPGLGVSELNKDVHILAPHRGESLGRERR